MDKNFSTGLDEGNPTYNEALSWLYSQLPMFSRVGAAAYKPGLQTSEALDAMFGHPHRKFKSIHVGGTNGKGSTSHMLASVLQAAGYKVGLYTSPHLVDFRERIRINGEMIPRDKVIDFVNRWRETEYEGHPSFFELTMMMAFDHFASEKVDYAIIEVGMGGRLDSTNIISPIATVITNISKDHTQFLGSTLPEIAREKAGIIKHGTPVVIGAAPDPDVHKVFSSRCAEMGVTPIWASESPVASDFIPLEEGGWQFKCGSVNMTSPLGGEYQKENLQSVLHTVGVLRKLGLSISDDALREGIAEVISRTHLAGRWMHLSEHPLVIADTGHNIDGLRHNMAQLKRILAARTATACESAAQSGNSLLSERPKLRIVIGFVADKAIDEILTLLPADAEYYVTNAAIPRALPATDLAAKFATLGLTHKVVTTAPEAYRQALAASDTDDILYLGGSTFVVADILANL